jgi:hypothetical protein
MKLKHFVVSTSTNDPKGFFRFKISVPVSVLRNIKYFIAGTGTGKEDQKVFSAV